MKRSKRLELSLQLEKLDQGIADAGEIVKLLELQYENLEREYQMLGSEINIESRATAQ